MVSTYVEHPTPQPNLFGPRTGFLQSPHLFLLLYLLWKKKVESQQNGVQYNPFYSADDRIGDSLESTQEE